MQLCIMSIAYRPTCILNQKDISFKSLQDRFYSNSFMSDSLFFVCYKGKMVRVLLYFKVKINCFLSKQKCNAGMGSMDKKVPFQILVFNVITWYFVSRVPQEHCGWLLQKTILFCVETKFVSCQILILQHRIYHYVMHFQQKENFVQ